MYKTKEENPISNCVMYLKNKNNCRCQTALGFGLRYTKLTLQTWVISLADKMLDMKASSDPASFLLPERWHPSYHSRRPADRSCSPLMSGLESGDTEVSSLPPPPVPVLCVSHISSYSKHFPLVTHWVATLPQPVAPPVSCVCPVPSLRRNVWPLWPRCSYRTHSAHGGR